MTKTISRTLLLLWSIFMVAALAFPVVVSAQDEAINDACKNAPNSPVCQDLQSGDDPVTGDDGLFIRVFNVLSIAAGVIAVIVIVIGGIQMMTADGEPQKFNSARNLIIYSIIGLLIVFLAQAIVRVIVYSIID